jgi:hypothetical protein
MLEGPRFPKRRVAPWIFMRRIWLRMRSEAMGVAAAGDIQFCRFTANIICLDDDPDRSYESPRLVTKIV